ARGKDRGLISMFSFEEFEKDELSFHQNTQYAAQSMSRPSKSIRLNCTMSIAQGFQTMNKNHLVHEKEHMQTDIPISPTDQVK
ncbi:hypothetical protein HAX54_003383, partial [Datura stramonium]|nr:hypothetical protein [Datura stramonium]